MFFVNLTRQSEREKNDYKFMPAVSATATLTIDGLMKPVFITLKYIYSSRLPRGLIADKGDL